MAGELVLAKVIQACSMESGWRMRSRKWNEQHKQIWDKKRSVNTNLLILNPYINYTLVNTQCTYIENKQCICTCTHRNIN